MGMERRTVVHTLGPQGTNCQAAAWFWLRKSEMQGEVRLHRTLEEATEVLLRERNGVLLGCIVYPDLHELVFSNLADLELRECFVMPTHRMLLACTDSARKIHSVATHPAPRQLTVDLNAELVIARSNSAAAALCSAGKVDACITTDVAARENGLSVLTDFGHVSMGFSIHGLRRSAPVAEKQNAG